MLLTFKRRMLAGSLILQKGTTTVEILNYLWCFQSRFELVVFRTETLTQAKFILRSFVMSKAKGPLLLAKLLQKSSYSTEPDKSSIISLLFALGSHLLCTRLLYTHLQCTHLHTTWCVCMRAKISSHKLMLCDSLSDN